MSNPEVAMTLDECVAEVLGLLTGLELSYEPELDRYRAVVRQINRALRSNALEREWSYYSSTEDVGAAHAGEQDVVLRASVRPRIIGDDAVRLCDLNGMPIVWAYFLPRDAVEKYPSRRGLWVSVARQSLHFSRPFQSYEEGLRILLPVMREPKMFRLPEQPEDPNLPLVPVPAAIRNQQLDFEFPDAVLQRAAFYYAQTDPVMQPRVQTLEQEYKNTFYSLNERDDRNTDAPFLNEWSVPIQGDVNATSYQDWHHPHSDERY
jgi:hypothetical protein